MNLVAPLSSKRSLMANAGFAVCHNLRLQPAWHTHDYAMLLWARAGGVKSAWLDDGTTNPSRASSARLSRNTVVLLPSAMPHRTLTEPRSPQHGELYLAPELARGFEARGVMGVDPATVAMLDALFSPWLNAHGAEHLVHALVQQLRRAPPVDAALGTSTLTQRMSRNFARALEWGDPLPTVEKAASELGVTMRRLQRECQVELGISPVTLRRRMLADKARSLLALGNSLTVVSQRLGFATSGHLTRLLQDARLASD
jgi:AraC-like DNA-binding protein